MRLLIKDIFLWLYWNPFRVLIQNIPTRSVYLFARMITPLIYLVARGKKNDFVREYKVILEYSNDHDQNRKVIKDVFFVLICNELDMLRYPVLHSLNIKSHVSCQGFEYLDQALLNGKGTMLLFAHFGANQMIMPTIGYCGYQMSQLSAPATVWIEKINDRHFSDMEKKALQKRWDNECSLPVQHINIFGSLKPAFQCLKRNEVLGVAIDGGGGKERTKVRFLGRDALFSHGAVDIALRTGCTVLPAFMVRQKNGRNVMHIMPPLQIPVKGDKQQVMAEVVHDFCQILESFVLRHPCHYINFLALRSFMDKQGDVPFFPVAVKSGKINHNS